MRVDALVLEVQRFMSVRGLGFRRLWISLAF